MVLDGVLKRAVVVHCRHVGCGLAGPQKLKAAFSTKVSKRRVFARRMLEESF